MKLSKIIPVFAVVLGTAIASHAAPASPFAGKWEVDKKKTTASGYPENLQVEIKPDGANYVIKSKYREPKNSVYPLLWVGIMTYELPLSTDGSEKTNQIGPFTHVSKTNVDGNTMTTDWRAVTDNGQAVEGQWVRSVSADGREMTCRIVSKASDGRSLDQTLVFKRK